MSAPRRDAGDRHRLHRAQPAHLPDPAAAVRRARRRDPGVRDVAVGARRRDRPGVGRRARPARAVPGRGATCAGRRTCGCSTEIPRFHRRARGCCSSPRARATPTRRCASSSRAAGSRRTSQRHFMEPLVAAVWSCDPDLALDYPARYLFTFLEHHGMLGVFGSPHVAHRHRRLPRVRRAGSPPGSPDVRTGTKVTSVLETARRRRGHRRQRRGRDVRRRASSPPTPTRRWRCWPSRPPLQRERAGGAALLRTTPRCCTPTPRCCRAQPSARASWNFQRPPRRRPAGVTVTYDLTRLQRLADRHPLPGHPRRRATSSTRRRCIARMRVRPPDLHPRRRSPRSAGCPRSTPTGSPSPARTTAGASTRTAPAPAWPPPSGWASRGPRPTGARVARRSPSSTGPRSATPAAQPFRHTFTYRSHTWLVDLDDLPDPAARTGVVRGARPPRRRRT